MEVRDFMSCNHAGKPWPWYWEMLPRQISAIGLLRIGNRQRNAVQPQFTCLAPLEGYGHRASDTQRSGVWIGGAWLPGGDDLNTT